MALDESLPAVTVDGEEVEAADLALKVPLFLENLRLLLLHQRPVALSAPVNSGQQASLGCFFELRTVRFRFRVGDVLEICAYRLRSLLERVRSFPEVRKDLGIEFAATRHPFGATFVAQ